MRPRIATEGSAPAPTGPPRTSTGSEALFFRAWFDGLVPVAGKVLPGGEAYSYLPASVRRFPGPAELEDRVAAAGFDPVAHRLLGGGIVVLLVGDAR